MSAGPAEGRVAIAIAIASALLGACTTTVGTLPKLAPLPAAEGFKMLKPGHSATACRSHGPLATPDDLLRRAFERLLATDGEANVVLNARVESTWWSIGVYGRRCVTVTGDVARSATTILLPMPGGHGAHAGHTKRTSDGH